MTNSLDKDVHDLNFLKNLSVVLNHCKEIDEINQIVGDKIKEIISDAYIVIGVSQEKRQYARISKIFGFEKTIDIIKKYLNKDPFKIKFPLKDIKLKELQELTSGKIFNVDNGLFTLSSGKIPKSVSKAIEVLLGIKKTYAMGISQNGILYGIVTILSKKDLETNNKTIIENIISQASIIIQKRIIEHNLKITEDKYSFLVENIKSAIYIINYEGRYLYANSYAASVVRKTKDDFIDHTIFEVYPGVNMDELLRDVRYVIDKKTELDREKEYIHEDKSIWFSTKIQPFFDTATEETVAVLTSTVITDKKLLEKDLLIAKLKAENSDSVKTAYIANLSHEIRSLMTGITGFAQIIKETETKDDINEYADIIHSNSLDLMKIFSGLVDITKIEAGIEKIDIKDFSLNHLLDSLYKTYSLQKKIRENNLDLKLIKNTKDIIIRTDEYKLNKIFVNLLDNAFKFCNNGFIEFGYNVDDKNQIEYFVKDSGIGISEEQKENIFERYYQAEDINIKTYPGAGVGLSLVKAFIVMLNGNIRVESKKGEGSSFIFSITLKEHN